MNGIGCGQYSRASGSESQSNETVAGDCERSLGIGSDLNDAALTRVRGGYEEIAVDIERKSLGTPEATVES